MTFSVTHTDIEIDVDYHTCSSVCWWTYCAGCNMCDIKTNELHGNAIERYRDELGDTR